VVRSVGLEEPSWELVLRRNSIERLKEEKFPLDIIHELPELIARGYEAVPEEDMVRLYWWGIAHDKPKVGTFMVRIKVAGGLLAPWQLRAIGAISMRYGRNYGELTTRQGIQLHWVRMEKLPEVLAAIQEAGLTTVGAEGDTVRNITTCPVAGISREELFDVRPTIAAVARFFWGNRDYSNLPRKQKFTISACPYQCNAPEIHDVALVGVMKEGRPGFAVRVGGGLSATPRISRDLGVFVPVEEAVDVLRAVTDVWQHNNRYRLSRAKARIKFLMDDYGPEAVRAMVEERLGRPLEDGAAPPPIGEGDHMGIHPQRQEGLYYVGFPVPNGRMTGSQMQQLADVVETVGGDIRLTREQNFIVGNVPEDRLGWLLEQVARLGFPHDRHRLYANSTACTSHEFCNYSVAETKGKLEEIVHALEERFGRRIEGLKIYMDGCPHACAHHWVGEIGLQGTTAPGPGLSKIEAYDITLRGGLGPKAAIGRPILRRIPHHQVTQVLERLVEAWLREREARGRPYSFRDFCDHHTDEELQAIALGQPLKEEKRMAIVRIPGPLLDATGGLDTVEVPPGTVREAIEAAGRLFPQLKARVLTPQGEVDPSVNLYVNEEDIRALQGLDTPLQVGDELVILLAMSGG
jgi:sulfite reductase beta subunit-like hemoprotein/molybdopterin converting factor small subunit